MRRFLRLLRPATAALLLAGCVAFPEPNPSPFSGARPPADAAAAPSVAPTAGAIHKVQPGDTVYRLAERYRVPLRSLIDINRLQPPYRLIPRQPLLIPKPREHKVAQGETVYGISRRYGVDLSALVKLNGIVPPFTILVGQTLRLPAPVEAESAVVAAPTQAVLPTSPVGATPAQAPVDAATGRAGIEVEQLDAAPPSATATTVPVATTVVPPPGANTSAAAPPPVSGPPAAVPPAKPATPLAGIVPEPAPRASSRFLWPVQGKIVSSFGPKKGGLHNDGINIASERGTPVRAAENGIVAYAGNELRGFGNLLLIKHADGWTSAYAHNDELLVRRGDQVKRGQIIARVGSTGSVTSPQLHFELREGARAVDPTKLLSRAQAGL